MERPKQVQDARKHADHDALSRMGRKGSKVAAENRALLKANEEYVRAAMIAEAVMERAKVQTISPEGDVLPPDPNIIADLEEIKNN
ncbi:MAG: hypothetical protein Q8P17_02815 [bacterium]|nr:hypothetical protein [bacterium]